MGDSAPIQMGHASDQSLGRLHIMVPWLGDFSTRGSMHRERGQGGTMLARGETPRIKCTRPPRLADQGQQDRNITW